MNIPVAIVTSPLSIENALTLRLYNSFIDVNMEFLCITVVLEASQVGYMCHISSFTSLLLDRENRKYPSVIFFAKAKRRCPPYFPMNFFVDFR